jgi:hypothetical protein
MLKERFLGFSVAEQFDKLTDHLPKHSLLYTPPARTSGVWYFM